MAGSDGQSGHRLVETAETAVRRKYGPGWDLRVIEGNSHSTHHPAYQIDLSSGPLLWSERSKGNGFCDMAGQGHRGTQGHGRSSRAGSWSVVAAASVAGSGSIDTRTANLPAEPVRRPATKATYRTLLLRGLTPDEAASLTAFLCGISVGSGRWHIDQVNALLFLRELQMAGRFGSNDGAAAA